MKQEIIDTVLNDEKEILSLIKKLVSYPSVKAKPAAKNMPFGKDCANCLEQTLEICRSYGFETRNLDGYVGYAEIGQGEELIGILTHLDVVPVDNEWSLNPFKPEIKDGRLYGRGVLDDKGPAAICMHILKVINESNFPLNKRIRIIFGLDEESGWEDMEYYLKNAEIPSIGFTPDADFPIIAGEKGIINLELTMLLNNDDIISIEGGNALNSVPSKASAKVMINDKEYDFNVLGKSAHASTPEVGDNVILSLMDSIRQSYDTENVVCNNNLINFFTQKIKDDYNGKYLDFALEDKESGKLTMNVGMIEVSDGIAKVGIDIRYPITYNQDDVIEQFEKSLKPYNFTINTLNAKKPIYFSKDNKLIKNFLKIYQESYDKDAKPIVIGGGTFARAMDNIVAFGPLFPDSEDTGHQKDEYMSIKDIMKTTEIYTKAILYLIETKD